MIVGLEHIGKNGLMTTSLVSVSSRNTMVDPTVEPTLRVYDSTAIGFILFRSGRGLHASPPQSWVRSVRPCDLVDFRDEVRTTHGLARLVMGDPVRNPRLVHARVADDEQRLARERSVIRERSAASEVMINDRLHELHARLTDLGAGGGSSDGLHGIR